MTLPASEVLRGATQGLHLGAERHPAAAALARGELEPAAYAEYLRQFGDLHAVLDPALAQAWPEFAALTRQDATERIAADLATLGAAPRCSPAAAWATWVPAWAHERDAALLGAGYVVHGAQNGGRVLARAQQGRLPVRYLDADAAHDSRWAALRAELDRCIVDPARAIAGARMAFGWAIAIFDVVHERRRRGERAEQG